jgi:hypothetical protein
MALTYADIQNRIPGLAFGTASVPTATQVTAMMTSLQKKFLVMTGTTYASDSGLHDEVLLLMSIIQLAEAYPAISMFASSIGQSSGTYTFNQEQVNVWRRELIDIIGSNFAEQGTDSIDFVNEASSYDDR